MTSLPAYGIRDSERLCDPLAEHVELLQLQGYTVLPSGFSDEAVRRLSRALDRVYAEQSAAAGGEEELRRIGDEGVVRAPLAYDPLFVELAAQAQLIRLAALMLGGYVVMAQQNGLINPPQRSFGQSAWHRDLPYQHFVSSRPLALGALLCVDPFTAENGATLVLPGSHRVEAFPSDAVVSRLAQPVLAASGAFIIFDAMLYHRAGQNRSNAPRRAVNQIFGRGFIRQQIDLPSMLDGRYADDPGLARLLGYDDRPARSVDAWRRARGAVS